MKLPPVPTFDLGSPQDICNKMREYATAAIEANRASVIEAYKASLKPVAWVIPGDDNARPDGWLDAKCFKDGEFSLALYRLDDQP